MKGKLGQLLAGVCVLCLSTLISLPLRAQVAGATLTGTVTDTQGGAIPNAKVSARNTATGVSTDTTTNAAGAYNIVNLVPGDYDVNVSAPGFSTVVTKVTLTVGATQALNPSLTVGQVTQEVQVTGVAPIVETTNATLSGEVVGTQIIELPLNGRDWAQLATLQPGVAQVRPHEAVDAPGGETRGLGMQMTVDGNRPQQNAYRLNGIIVNDYSNAGPGNVLGANMGVDAIQEFSVLTSNYSAEYGFTSGGVINAITKSGTNTFHGSAYEFVRNSAFDAANFFENANNEKKGSFTRNQFGASAGWKVLKDRAFLFGDYEGLRQSKAIPQTAQTLTFNARLGILNDQNGNPLPPLPPGPCVISGSTNTALNGQPLPNSTRLSPLASMCVDNTIEKLVNPSGTPAGGLEPLPNGALLNNVAQFVSDGNQKVTDNYSTVRGDLKITDKDSLVGTWYRDHSTWTKPDSFNQDINGFQVPHAAYSLEENHIFSSAMVNTLRLGLNQSNLVSPAISTSNPLELDTTLGILPGCTAPGVSIGSGGLSVNSATADTFGGFTGAQGFYAKTAIIQLFDDVSRTTGKHNFKFGFMYLGNHQDWGQGAGCGGSASFSSIPDFLQNIPSQVRMPTLPPFTSGPTTHHYRQKIFGGYFQDDWKFRSNLTFNLGLRYEMATIPTETQDKINQLETLWQNPNANGPCVANLQGLATCTGFYHQTFQHNPTLKNFEPRIGFAWDPFKTGKTSVRGGFGVFDNLPLSYMFALNSLQVAPNGAEVDLNNPGQGTYPVGFAPIALGTSATASSRYGFNEQFPKRNYIMQWNLNVQRQVSPSTSVTLAYAGSRGIHNPFQTDELNTVFPFSTSAGWLFPTTPSAPDPNNVIPTGTPVVCSSPVAPPGACGNVSGSSPTGIVPGQRINPNVALIQSTIFQAQSWYEALQARVDKRLSHNLQVGGSFTWGKSLDTSSSSFAGDNYSNNITPTIEWWDIHLTKGPSDFNVTRNVVINALWTVPTPASFTGPLSFVAKGWELGAVFEASDGTPLWTLGGIEGDPMGQLNGEPMSIPDYVSGCNLTNPSTGRSGTLQYINPNCYINAVAPNAAFFNAAPPFGCDKTFIPNYAANNPTLPPLNPLTCINLMGNLGRNTVIGPGLLNLDFSVVKDNYIKRITESFNVQFRAEFFNVLNRANFAPPKAGNLEALSATGTPQAGFGILTTTQVPNREIQFALKLIW
jgi:Carboxypeptidase regulatory-like domain/TonB dependent receptor